VVNGAAIFLDSSVSSVMNKITGLMNRILLATGINIQTNIPPVIKRKVLYITFILLGWIDTIAIV